MPNLKFSVAIYLQRLTNGKEIVPEQSVPEVEVDTRISRTQIKHRPTSRLACVLVDTGL